MKHYDYLTGYKATNEDMTCQGFKFKLGKWYKHDGDVVLCKSGFHFCVHPSGPWAYYSNANPRFFKVEARDAYEEYEPGADLKLVCREIRLIEEIKVTGDMNTGNRNTGDRNTGDRNTGHGNATDFSSGFFCQKEPLVISFDKQTRLTHKQYIEQYPAYYQLCDALSKDKEFDYSQFKTLPGWMLKKCKALHQKYIDGRKSQ